MNNSQMDCYGVPQCPFHNFECKTPTIKCKCCIYYPIKDTYIKLLEDEIDAYTNKHNERNMQIVEELLKVLKKED